VLYLGMSGTLDIEQPEEADDIKMTLKNV
jgi:hypothetical protein